MADIRMIDGADDAAIAGWIHTRLAAALCARPGELAVTVPGGTTPFPILEKLVAGALPFARLAVWPGDDRIVPEDHPASNLGRLRGLLEPAGARLVPLVEGAVPPRFAFAWLGMGADGHIASLFPSANPSARDAATVRRIVPDPLPPEAPFARLSLTIAALLAADCLMFVMRGAQKRAVFEAAARGQSDTPIARLLAATPAPVTCFC